MITNRLSMLYLPMVYSNFQAELVSLAAIIAEIWTKRWKMTRKLEEIS